MWLSVPPAKENSFTSRFSFRAIFGKFSFRIQTNPRNEMITFFNSPFKSLSKSCQRWSSKNETFKKYFIGVMNSFIKRL